LTPAAPTWNGHNGCLLNGEYRNGHHAPSRSPDPEFLRRVAWEIGEKKPAEWYTPTAHHCALISVNAYQGFAHWRIRQEWVDQLARSRGEGWNQCRMVLRLYDVSYITFNGFNAHRIQDESIGHLAGHRFFTLPRPGTWQLAEVGFLFRNGEFVPAARSQAVQFPRDAVSHQHSHAALLVDDTGRIEEIGNLWEQDRVLQERRKPKIRGGLRIAAFAFAGPDAGPGNILGRFVTELAAGQAAHGHEVHVFAPATGSFQHRREVSGVVYEPLPVSLDRGPIEAALEFARAAEKRLRDLPTFDLLHLHEWMTGMAPWIGTRPTVLSLTSIETTRRNGTPPTPLSLEIQHLEKQLAHMVDCILTPDWLRQQAIAEFGIDEANVHAFPMEARLPNDWSRPLDLGQIKREAGLGPLDRILLFIGPLEHAAGVDLLVEALPVALRRAPNLRLVFVGEGSMHHHLQQRAQELGVGWAIRLLGHVEGPWLTRLLRAAEAVVLPSRSRVAMDDGVVELARRAGRPVVTTHAGPAHLVQHERTGLVTYDNPGSMVWALDRILGDPAHAERMGQEGRHGDSLTIAWGDVARHYLELCATCFPELRAEEGR
jgi:glycosyltransferase involved in cell wall biosynthesis